MNANLTVLMPISSVNKFLKHSVDSIKNQTYKNFFCYILSPKLDQVDLSNLNNIISNDKRFKIFQLNLDGIAFALNYGLNLVKTKYVARMDGDDISYPKRFERQINFLESNSEYVAVGCNVKFIDENNNYLKWKLKFYENDKSIRRALKYRMPLIHPALIFRTKILFSNKGYLYGNTAEDHELYLRIARNPNSLFKNLPEYLFSYRKHNSQLTKIENSKKAYIDIGGFLFTEFLRSWDPLFLIGIFANNPNIRKFRNFFRKFIEKLSKN